MMKMVSIASSLANIERLCPSESLGSNSRYVILSGLRMGDGGREDELAAVKKQLAWILGRWYFPKGYTLVLNGDIEDMRSFWLKDIQAAWADLYRIFDDFHKEKRLRKIVGDRDLSLLRLVSYPYPLSHGLKLEGLGSSVFIVHGHQAAAPFVGRDYLSDYMVRWLGFPRRKPEGKRAKGGKKTEARLQETAPYLRSVLVEGHTKRPLFESLPRSAWAASAIEAHNSDYHPSLFCPGRFRGPKTLRVLEIEGESLGFVRWTKGERGAPGTERGMNRELARSIRLEELASRIKTAAEV